MVTTDTRTFKLVLAYNGARFKGWQRGNGRTVQSTLEETILQYLGQSGSAPTAEIVVNGSGRTDAGVHAEGQVASLVLPDWVEPERLFAEVNLLLPSDCTIRSIEQADHRFHARYAATAKVYRYRIVDGPVGNPFVTRFSWRRPNTLSIEAMREAARFFLGEHDFRSFTADRKKANTVRRIYSMDIDRGTVAAGPVLDIVVRGDGFLWKQIRTMVGVLTAVGSGDVDASAIAALLDPSKTAPPPPVAPAHGLTLLRVEY